MKRKKISYDEVWQFSNCRKAILNAVKHKRHKTRQMMNLIENTDKYAEELSVMLKDKNYSLSNGFEFDFYDQNRRKTRHICQPKLFPDQCIHWALMQVISPYFRKSFTNTTYSSIPGRGAHLAKDRINAFLHRHKDLRYCLQLDIRHYYPSIDKEILIRQLDQYFKDKRITELCKNVINAYKGDGLPIGYYTSAWFSNFYLKSVDEYLTKHYKYYARYADDMVIYHQSSRVLHRLQIKLKQYLGKELHLKLKPDWQVYRLPNRPTDFCGFKLYGYKTTLRKIILNHLKKISIRLSKKKYIPHRARQFMAYLGYLKATDSKALTKKLNININKLRSVISYDTTVRNNYSAIECTTG